MNLTDKEILELHELCSGLVDQTLTAAQRERLAAWLTDSEEARRYYVRVLGLSASLCHYAGEMQLEERDSRVIRVGWGRFAWAAAALAAAAGVALAVWLGNGADSPLPSAGTAPDGQYVARLTGSSGVSWAANSRDLRLGDHLRAGQRIDVRSGYAEVTFDSGAQVVLKGPAALDLNSPWDGSLRSGAIRAYVPPEAVGFRISHPSVEVVDLGTEFSMVADSSGAAEVLVLKGEVEAAPRSAPTDQDAILLQARQARKFGRSGVTELPSSDQAFDAVTREVDLDRYSPAMHYLHWTFDRDEGGVLPAEAVGLAQGDYNMRLGGLRPGFHPLTSFDGGRRGLRFDGSLFGRARVPGLSRNGAHTISFWVKVPEEAPLVDSYAMVAWASWSKKSPLHPVHISWNRTPEEGPLGALRTDFSGGSALGTTSLRDGRWHHIAVVFSPGDVETAVQVHQYVDGKLESNTTNPPRRTAPIGPSKKLETPADLRDELYVGCRLGANGQKRDRFVGDIDELFVANWGLEPNEIVRVMKDNRLSTPGAALALR